MRTTKRHTDIAVLGGGFAGVYATKTLTEQLAKRNCKREVTIVSDDNHIVFQPMLPEVASSSLSPRHVVNPIRHLCRRASVIKGEVTDFDPERKTVTIDAGPFIGPVELSFDQLAVCVGSRTDVSMIPGMQEHAFLMQNVGDAMLLRATLISRFEEANLADNDDLKRRLLSFTLVGGGYSGVETAGQILDAGRAICRFYKGIDFADCSFTLVHSGDALMPTAHHTFGTYAKRKLEQRSLKVLLGRRVSAVTANRVYLNDDSSIETNTVVCTVGNAPHPFLGILKERGISAFEKGRLRTQEDGSVEGASWLWGAGDCCYFPHPKGGPCPPTAQFATRQGKHIGTNICKRILGEDTGRFRFEGLGELATIGHRTAVAEVKGLRFSGFFAWWLWRTIYLTKLPGIERKVRVLFDWTLELFFPRDITLLNPRYSSDVNYTYLRDGDRLYNAGDPAFSFYIVKEGRIELRENGSVVKTARQGQHFGERALLGEGYFQFDAVATEPTTLVSVNRVLFESVFKSDDVFAENLRRSAASHLSEKELSLLIDRLPRGVLEQDVASLMTRDVVSFRLDQSIPEAAETLRERPRNYMPVLDEEDRVVRIVRKESLYLKLQVASDGCEQAVGDLPHESVPTVDPGDSIKTAVTVIARSGHTKAVVVDEENHLQGIIALVDIVTLKEPTAKAR